jgi:hypothetical protein
MGRIWRMGCEAARREGGEVGLPQAPLDFYHEKHGEHGNEAAMSAAGLSALRADPTAPSVFSVFSLEKRSVGLRR